MPIEVIYCKICDLPPEYCMVEKKDCTECKVWLKTAHPELYEKIWAEEEAKAEGEESKGDQPP